MLIYRISNDTWIISDLLFLQGLLDVFPFASDDIEARSAVWSILARLLIQIQKTEMSPSNLHQYVSVLTSKSEVVEDELLNYDVDDTSEDHERSAKLTARSFAVSFLIYIQNSLFFWIKRIFLGRTLPSEIPTGSSLDNPHFFF